MSVVGIQQVNAFAQEEQLGLCQIRPGLSPSVSSASYEYQPGKARLRVLNIKGKICTRIVIRLVWLTIIGVTTSMSTAQAQQTAPATDTHSLLSITGEPAQTNTPAVDTGLQSSSIGGTVVDTNGAVVPGAQVQLIGPNGTVARTVAANQLGGFLFTNLPAGTFKVSVSAPNLTPVTSDQIALTTGQHLQLPQTVLHVGKTHADVQVVATLHDVAQAQVKAQEKQRVLGVVPNFYSSYIWNAAPMSPKQKFGLALRSSVDPVTFVVAAGTAGIEQWHNTFPGYGTGAEGYFKRFGAAYADYSIYTMIADAALPTLLKQDPRYFYMGNGSVKSRALYAMSRTFVCRGDNGRTEVNWSHLLGSFATAGISNVYHAPQDRTASLTVRNAGIIIGGSVATNLIREFILRKLTSKVPDYAQGKP